MSKTRYKWMLFIVLILLTSNIILAFLLTGFKAEKQEIKKKPADRLSPWYSEVGLEQHQIDTFRIFREDYFKVMKPVWNEIRELKDSLYAHLEKSPDDSLINHYLQEITQRNLLADKNTFSHFSRLRTMCTDEQRIRFDTIIPKMLNRPWNRSRK